MQGWEFKHNKVAENQLHMSHQTVLNVTCLRHKKLEKEITKSWQNVNDLEAKNFIGFLENYD